MTEFYDAATWTNIPEGSVAAVAFDGKFAVPKADADARFAKYRYITVLGNFTHCGIADFEAGDAVYSQAGALRGWALGRKSMGCLARVYCDRANLAKAMAEVDGVDNVRWWISTLQLDNGKQWTAAELVADIAAREELKLDPGLIWAVQFEGGMTAPVDKNLLLGAW